MSHILLLAVKCGIGLLICSYLSRSEIPVGFSHSKVEGNTMG